MIIDLKQIIISRNILSRKYILFNIYLIMCSITYQWDIWRLIRVVICWLLSPLYLPQEANYQHKISDQVQISSSSKSHSALKLDTFWRNTEDQLTQLNIGNTPFSFLSYTEKY